MTTILFDNDGVTHIGLLSGDGYTLCGYLPDGWVGRAGPSDPEKITEAADHPCGTCLRSLRSRTDTSTAESDVTTVDYVEELSEGDTVHLERSATHTVDKITTTIDGKATAHLDGDGTFVLVDGEHGICHKDRKTTGGTHVTVEVER